MANVSPFQLSIFKRKKTHTFFFRIESRMHGSQNELSTASVCVYVKKERSYKSKWNIYFVSLNIKSWKIPIYRKMKYQKFNDNEQKKMNEKNSCGEKKDWQISTVQ